MTPEQCKAHVDALTKKRTEIQNQILELNKKRTEYVALKRKEMAEKSGGEAQQTLDEVVASTVRSQAEKKGYAFKK